MVPYSIKSNLAGLRRRERLLTFAWGLACWVSIVLVLLLMGGLIDWLIDRQRDTPLNLRIGIACVQVFIAIIAGLWFLVWPQIRRLPDTTLALWVEDKLPTFEHRLISAVQFNQPGAQVHGMSVESITVVTREAEQEARRLAFRKIADHARLKWAILVLTPVLLLAAAPFLLWPELSFALFRRLAFESVEIPHSVSLASISPKAWLIGETIPIRYRVTGEFDDEMKGKLFVTPEGQPTDTYELTFYENRTDPETGQRYGVLAPTSIPPPWMWFIRRGWRTAAPGNPVR